MISALLTTLGILSLFSVGKISAKRFPNSFFKYQVFYQLITLAIAISLVTLNRLQSTKQLAILGNIDSNISNMKWLGFPAGTTWTSATPTYFFAPLLVTTIVVYIQVSKNIAFKNLIKFLPIAIPFSLLNSFTEELIFRVIGVEGLTTSIAVTAIICGAWFGIPHYFGTPGKIPGVIMAGFLGWAMALSMLNTGGIAIAWLIHFGQDIPILTMLFASKGSSKLSS